MASSLAAGAICPCSSPTLSPASSPAARRGALLRGRPRLDPRRIAHQRADDERPVTDRHLLAHPVPGQMLVGGIGQPRRGHRHPARGSSSSTVRSRSPKITMAAVRGMGVAVMTRRSGSPALPLGPQGGPLLDPEAVLLVDHHHAQRSELDLLGEQRMRPHHDARRPLGQVGQHLRRGPCPSPGWSAAPPGTSSPPNISLTAAACCSASTSVGTISAPWCPLWTAPSSAARATTVLPDPTSPWSNRCMGNGPARSATITARARRWAMVSSKGSAARKRATSVPLTAPVISRGDTVVAQGPGVVLEGPAAQHQCQLEAEQLVEDQPAAGRRDHVHRLGPVHRPHRRRPVPQRQGRPPTLGQRVHQLAGPLERLLHEGADLPTGEAGLGRGRVDGKDAQGPTWPARRPARPPRPPRRPPG